MTLADRQFISRLAMQLARAGRVRARPRVLRGTGSGHGSKTLARAMMVVPQGPRGAAIVIPHYWAIYVHDGRGPFGPKKQGYYVYFRDPKKDPRLVNGHSPVRMSQKRRLTKLEFSRGLDMNADHIARGGDPNRLPMIVTKQIFKGMRPNKFFSNRGGGGMSGFRREADSIVDVAWRRHVMTRLKPILDIRGTVRVRL